ncbi:pilus assembly protein [Chitinimonas lacunae]|uniref:Pilus assembly protein n=1 Tax=Chitinimonas lacunae TaxID=1963018 RepID=A0ABV8MTJ6_9NEIS
MELRLLSRCGGYLLALGSALLPAAVTAVPLNISDTPLFIKAKVAPLNLLLMGRDHRLYYEAYNDASDLDDDGTVDMRYKPDNIDYYGYFDSYKCYSYNTSSSMFVPTRTTANKRCTTVDSEWSGDFLNYLTTARIDAIRKVLYGGYRVTDTATQTVLERTSLPQDAHSWGKEYSDPAIDGYDIRDYSPLALPGVFDSTKAANDPTRYRHHLFANTTLLTNTSAGPLLRVVTTPTTISGVNYNFRIWQWLSVERPVADAQFDSGNNTKRTIAPAPTNYRVRVQVCVAGLLEDNCRLYGTSAKPDGLLQEYGRNGRMLFGLMSGSYTNNLEGGVLRRPIGNIDNEINSTDGTLTSTVGIIRTLDRLQTIEFGGSYQYNCGWSFATQQLTNGNCKMWGNPLGEMMYEAIRYYAGKGTPISSYTSGITNLDDSDVTLPLASWDNPYDPNKFGTGSSGRDGRDWCSKAFITTLSDANPSFDGELPGTAFGSAVSGNDLSDLNVQSLGQAMWDKEFGAGTSRSIFAGQVGSSNNGAPTAKTASTFGNIRGLAPEDPTRQGTYYSAAVAYYGRTRDLNNAVQGVQSVTTYSIALASPLPRFRFKVGSGHITLIPFAKSVGGSSISAASGAFQPTNQIVDFYIESISTNASGEMTGAVFRINYEDVENGADHDMDAIAKYTVTTTSNQLNVTVDSDYAAGGIIQHMGYVLSGSNSDGMYLVVRDRDTAGSTDPNYYLDQPHPASCASGDRNGGICPLPLTDSRSFTASSSSSSGTFLNGPLWYMAKFGGFEDLKDANNTYQSLVLDGTDEWDGNNDGDPDNYFLVINPLKLKQQLGRAIDDIFRRSASAASVATSSTSVQTDSNIYQALFDSNYWTGDLIAQKIAVNSTTNEASIGTVTWRASTMNPRGTSEAAARKIFTTNSSTRTGVAFNWANLSAAQQAALNYNPTTGTTDTLGQSRLNWLRGDDALELDKVNGIFRKRGNDIPGQAKTTFLGDIVYSNPFYVGAPGADIEDSGYATFRTANQNRRPAVYVGANDGMLHAFDASSVPADPPPTAPTQPGDAIAGQSGKELFAYVPSAIYPNLSQLPDKNYQHLFYVDGAPTVADALVNNVWTSVLVGGLNKGGKAIYALNVTDPLTFSASNVMWEFSSSDDADLGYTYSQPQIVKLNNNKWAVIIGNGYNSTNERAALYIVFLDGPGADRIWNINSEYIKIDTGWTNASNGLSSPTPIDTNLDGKADIIYAGDIQGNMWKFDLSSTSTSDWRVGLSGQPLFVAKDGTGGTAKRQPIYMRPKVALHPVYFNQQRVNTSTRNSNPGLMVYFGTGKYMEDCDITNTCGTHANMQSFYGIWDDDVTIASRNDLLSQTYARYTGNTGAVEQGITTDNPIAWRFFNTTVPNSVMGWYFDMTTDQTTSPASTNIGERTLSAPLIASNLVIANTVKPSPLACDFGGTGWLVCAKYDNGGKCSNMSTKEIGAALGGINFVDSFAPSDLTKLRRIDEAVGGFGNTTVAIMTTTAGETKAQNVSLERKIRRVSWRELTSQ